MVNKKAIFEVFKTWLFILCLLVITEGIYLCLRHSLNFGAIIISILIFITISVVTYIGYIIENSDNEPG
jgi:uncharacterized membrane protein (DUF4010 family)